MRNEEVRKRKEKKKEKTTYDTAHTPLQNLKLFWQVPVDLESHDW